MIEKRDPQLMTKQELIEEITELETWAGQFDHVHVGEPSELLDHINATYDRVDLLRHYLAEFDK